MALLLRVESQVSHANPAVCHWAKQPLLEWL